MNSTNYINEVLFWKEEFKTNYGVRENKFLKHNYVWFCVIRFSPEQQQESQESIVYTNINNMRHRIDGPAYIDSLGNVAYYIDGKQFSEQDYLNNSKVIAAKLKQILEEL